MNYLLKNHNRRPVGSIPFNETNMIERNVCHQGCANYFVRGRFCRRYYEKSDTNTFEQGNFHGHGLSLGRGNGRGHRRGHIYERHLFAPRNDNFKHV